MSLPLEVPITLPNGKTYQQPTGLFINNEFVASSDKETISVTDPGTGDEICSVYVASTEDVDTAVKVAREAYETKWKPLSSKQRSTILSKISDLIVEHSDQVADLEAIESGKPKSTNAIYDVLHAADVFKYYSGLAISAGNGKTIDSEPTKFTYTIQEPFGVCAAIIAWNFPVSTLAWKLAPCLAAGNSIIVKTAENTPLSALYLCKLFKEAGVPAGVVNVTCGLGRICGSALASHHGVDKVSFTGSTGVGKTIQRLAAENLKACTLECGGKSPLVIYDDCDLDQAVKYAAFGIFFNKGEICTASSRIYVQDNIYDEFLVKYKQHVEENYKQGGQFTEGVTVGPQVSEIQRGKILEYIQSGIEEGARLVTGGKAPEGLPAAGHYLLPTILADCNQKMKVVQEEIFGPVVTVSKFSTDEESIEFANDCVFGLAAYLFTNNIERSQKFITSVQAGQVFVNATFATDYRMPFGGYKMSGIGRELGEAGMAAFMQTKSVHINYGSKL
ncbi:hypothetical protein CANARDRAFT_196675 [[Candida] arabinofermentans NRRL YB-2248]|uniref:Aldehyde dehydrogenase domain-containing protein n=1 Tax=[Candida] arabinofermentans NRRL YB-2248 TaxID=983967 RepID=A0A1E4T3J1_9ASCO|nr:hypothetical protein CANARDRAFT_196675 [[Candida] arabinofermentans NRRL YB-2248]